jgi:ribonuclease HI
VFETKPNVIPSLCLRLHQTILDPGIDLKCIANYSIPGTTPWLLLKPNFNYSLYNVGTKSSTSPDEFLSSCSELISLYQGYENMFTDGSKQGSAVASVAVNGNKILVKRLPNNASIFSAESSAILLVLDMISQTSNLKFLILSDSLSCINSIENKDFQNPFIVEILERLLNTGVCITFVWVPSHIGIAGNTAADATAKAGLCLQISNSLIPYSDLKPLITSHLNNC